MWEITLIGNAEDYMHFLVFEKMIKTKFESNVIVAISENNYITSISIAVKSKKFIFNIKKLVVELIIKICKEEYFIDNLKIDTEDKDLEYFILLTAVLTNLEDEVDYARVKLKFFKTIHIRSLVRFRLSRLYNLWERFAIYFNYNFSGVVSDKIYLDFLKFLAGNARSSGEVIYLVENDNKMYIKDKNQNNLVVIPRTDEIGVIVNLIVFAPEKLIINCYSSLSDKVVKLIEYLFADKMSILI